MPNPTATSSSSSSKTKSCSSSSSTTQGNGKKTGPTRSLPGITKRAREHCTKAVEMVSNKKPKKNGQNQHKAGKNRGRNRKKKEAVLVKKEGPSLLKKDSAVYCSVNWNGRTKCPLPKGVPNPTMIPVEEMAGTISWDELDSEEKTLIVYKEVVDGENDFLLAKVSRRQVQELKKGPDTSPDKMRKVFDLALRMKPDIARGSGRGGVGKVYKCFGWNHLYRPEKDLFQYTTKRSCTEETEKAMNKDISGIVKGIEGIALRVLRGIKDFDGFRDMKEFLDLPSVRGKEDPADDASKDEGICTQLAIANGGYWSQLHVDDDYIVTMLSVLAADPKREDEVLYTFNFPTFDISVPMKSGDILLFNSKYEHCSSNPVCDEDYIFSMYVSNSAVDTKMRKTYRKASGEV